MLRNLLPYSYMGRAFIGGAGTIRCLIRSTMNLNISSAVATNRGVLPGWAKTTGTGIALPWIRTTALPIQYSTKLSPAN